ncbi:MAG: hypothetical protein FWC19_02430 [Treponema sp.]|nr:hypothetical protein [Treponema sp.]
MKKKILIIAFVFFALFAAGIYAQNISLREGYYQTQGSADHVYITSNCEISSQGNSPENGFLRKAGSYGVMAWAGLPNPDNIIYGGTANIAGDEFRINIQRLHARNVEAVGLTGIIFQGTFIFWNIVNNETFLDVAGNRWVWRRQR